MRRVIVEQFKHPHGVLGRIAGWIMSHRESNRLRNEWVVSLLGIQPSDCVLEVGCGPGIALGAAADLASDGRVIGVDHSALMVTVAEKRNADAIARGRLEVVHGTAETAAGLGLQFDRVYAVNVVQFWDSPVETLRALRRAMAPGGIIAVALQPRNKGATDEDAYLAARRNQSLLEQAGFRNIRVETLDLKPVVACVLAET